MVTKETTTHKQPQDQTNQKEEEKKDQKKFTPLDPQAQGSGNFTSYTVYLYDLPKIEYSSHKLAEVFKHQAGIFLSDVPYIDRDARKVFYTGQLKIRCDSKEAYHEMCEKIRYFEIDGKECRALCHEKNLKRGGGGDGD